MAQGTTGTMAQPPDPVQAKIAPYTGRTSLFLFGGISLILANIVLSPNGWQVITAFAPTLAGTQPPGGNQTQTSILDIVGQVVILGALLLIGSVSDEAGTFALVFLAALWLGFLYSHRALFAGLVGQTTPGASPSGGTPSTNSTNAWQQH